MILILISTLLIGFSLWTSYKDFRKDSSLVKFVYFQRPKDWLISFGIVTLVLFSIMTLVSMDLPKFMTWSWVSLLSSGQSTGGNIIFTPFSSGSIAIVLSFWFILSLALPYLAKSEEVIFRSFVFSTKKRILKNIEFGLVHMIVGVPLVAALVLAVAGFLFSVCYVKAFNKACAQNPSNADHVATNVATSVHAKYNFIILSFITLVTLLTLIIA